MIPGVRRAAEQIFFISQPALDEMGFDLSVNRLSEIIDARTHASEMQRELQLLLDDWDKTGWGYNKEQRLRISCLMRKIEMGV
jgi:hypothetical protein